MIPRLIFLGSVASLFALNGLRLPVGDVAYAQAPQTPAALITTAAEEKALLDRTCGACHSQRAKAAGLEPAQRLTLDALDTAHVEKNPEKRSSASCARA